jgi:hypothetical protein
MAILIKSQERHLYNKTLNCLLSLILSQVNTVFKLKHKIRIMFNSEIEANYLDNYLSIINSWLKEDSS